MPLLTLAALADLPVQLGQIFYFVVLPMLLLIGLGYLLASRLGLDMPTLVRLNFYVIVPGIVFHALVSSRVTAGNIGLMIGFHVLVVGIMAGLGYLSAVLRGIPPNQRNALMMSVMFFNSGNYGLPLQELAFARHPLGGTAAMALQIFSMLVQNFTGFTVGVVLAATGGETGGRIRENLRHMLRFPPLYALASALIVIGLRRLMGPENAETAGKIFTPLWQALSYVRGGFVVVALITLGAQLARVSAEHRGRYPINLAVGLRLLGGPAVGLTLIYLFHLFAPGLISPAVAQVLLISTTTPTAVNAMLLSMEFDNHPDFLARSVFYSTLISPLTVTAVVFIAQSGLLGPLRMS